MRYRREVDGLRSVAVLPVILFHAGFEVFGGGYVGVDIFFVISGYLITSIILGELAEGRFSLVRFYERRIRRILPALFTVLLVCVPVAWCLMLPLDYKDFAQSVVAVSVYASNFLFWIESGYFDTASELKPLLHTWSLAVEEQYYVFFPLLLMVLWRLGPRRLFYLIAAIALASLCLSEWMVRSYPSANFFLLPSRAWELLAGSLCAFLQFKRGQWANQVLSLLGLALIVMAVFVYTPDTPFPSLYALAPVGGTALILLFASGDTLVARLLGLPLFVGIGLISYSAYLWHQPLFAFVRIANVFEPSHLVMAALSLVSLGLAWLSWYFVEQPFRRRQLPALPTRTALFGTAALVSTVFIALGVATSFTHVQGRYWRAQASTESLETYDLIRRTWQDPVHRSRLALQPDSCVFASQVQTAKVYDRVTACADRFGPGLALIGDSHGVDAFGTLTSAYDGNFVAGLAQGGCQAHTPQQKCQYDDFLAFVRQNPGIFSTIVYQQIGLTLLRDAHGNTGTRGLFDKLPMEAEVPDYPIKSENIDEVVAYLETLQRAAPEARIVWLGPRAEPHIPHRYMIRKGCDASYALRPNQTAAYERLDSQLHDRLAGTPIHYVSQMELMEFDITRDFMTCDVLYWSDGDHFSRAGEERFGKRIVPGLLPSRSAAEVPPTGESEHPHP